MTSYIFSQTNTPSGNVGIYYGRLYLSKDKVYRTILADPKKRFGPILHSPSFGREEIAKSFVKLYLCRRKCFPRQAVRLVKEV